jgi:RNA polymerase sigma factor (sigma-70 family)
MLTPTIEKHYRENYRKTVKRMSFRSGLLEDAEDIVQEAYYRALRYQRSFNGEDFNRWFATILNNCLREHKNNEKNHVSVDIDDMDEEEVACAFYPSRIMAEILGMIEGRPPVQAEILTLYFHYEYSARDISRVLPHSYAQIHQTIQRFRNELKEIYND